MSNRVERAVSCFLEGFNCSQAVFSAFAEDLGLDTISALKTAGAFGGGMAYSDETCGAVTGALMLIGLKYGKTEAGDQAAKEKTYVLVQEFMRKFKARRGDVRCTALLGYNLGNPDEMCIAKEQGLFRSICPALVRDAAEIIEEILF